jgi:hypothetical protein
VRRFLAAAVVLAALVVTLDPPPPSGANLTARSTNAGNQVRADTPANYLHLYSQSTDPAALGNYADKRLSSPVVKAATGVDSTLKLALGNWRNGGTMQRAFTLQTAATLPAATVTVSIAVTSTPWNYTDTPANIATIAAAGNGNTGGAPTVTLGPNQKRQVNIVVPQLLGLGISYPATLSVTVTYTGYTGTFLRYDIPLTVYDGLTGGGP